MLSTLIQLAGFGCIVATAALVSPILGLAVAGIVLLLIGHAVDAPRRKRKT
jgi:phosphate/sulfate permease